MPRAVLITAVLAVLAACSSQPQAPEPVPVNAPPPEPSIQQWLALQREVGDMTAETAVQRLVEVDRPRDVGQIYYYGLLNQQLETYGAWTQARDTFQKLESHPELEPAKRHLLNLLRQYNQNRINWYLKNRDLQSENAQLRSQLVEIGDEKAQLEQKIQALTELEAVISTRKEE